MIHMLALTQLFLSQIWKDVVVYVNSLMKAGYEDGLKGIDKYPTGMF